MKNAILITAVALMATPAMASKARLNSLNNSAHLEDVQEIFRNSSKITAHGEWLTFEMGPNPGTTATDTNPRAEGGFARSMGDANYGFYLGHRNAFAVSAPLGSRQTTYLADENPVDLFYGSKAGDLNWGLGLHYSKSDKKTTQEKQDMTSLNVGVSGNNWDVAADIGLMNNYKNEAAGVDFKGKTGIGVNGEYTMDTMTFSAGYGMNGGKTTDAAGTTTVDLDKTAMQIGVVNSHKAEGSDFFYGVDYVMTTNKEAAADTKTETSQLPVFAGIEANANSWLVLRASVAQNFILGSTKTTVAGTGEADTIANNTTVAAGAGLKFGKLLVDGTLSGSSTGNINGNSMLANAALTYLF